MTRNVLFGALMICILLLFSVGLAACEEDVTEELPQSYPAVPAGNFTVIEHTEFEEGYMPGLEHAWVIHDETRKVTCWVFWYSFSGMGGGVGTSCLSDTELP